MKGNQFSESDCRILESIIRSRRDVRGQRFTDREVTDEVVDRLLDAALNAPSVGYSQPWSFVVVRDMEVRKAIRQSFNKQNETEAEVFDDERARRYTRLKLEGILEAPVNIAVFYQRSQAPVLGQTSMPEVGLYSVVCAVQNMWLLGRALNLGIGWVSILDPAKVSAILNAPGSLRLVAYLCVGYVDEFAEQPELETLGWEKRKSKASVVALDRYP